MTIPGPFSAPGIPLQGGGLASQAAQMSFAAAPLQQQGHNGMAESGTRGMRDKGRIRDVWKGNLHEEMAALRLLVDKYPYISMVRLLLLIVGVKVNISRTRNFLESLLVLWALFTAK